MAGTQHETTLSNALCLEQTDKNIILEKCTHLSKTQIIESKEC
jgi:hypothetical protein